MHCHLKIVLCLFAYLMPLTSSYRIEDNKEEKELEKEFIKQLVNEVSKGEDERSDFPPNYKNYGNDNRYYNDLFDHPDDNDEIEMEDIDEDISMRDPRPWIRLRRILNTGHRWYQKAKSKVPKLIRRTRKWYRIGKQHFPHFMSTARSRYPDFMNLVEKVLENKSNRKIDFKEGPHIE